MTILTHGYAKIVHHPGNLEGGYTAQNMVKEQVQPIMVQVPETRSQCSQTKALHAGLINMYPKIDDILISKSLMLECMAKIYTRYSVPNY